MGHAERQVAATLQPFWMPFSANKEFKSEPRMFARAKGMYFYTPDGREVIDASSGLFCVAAGHCRDEIAQAVFEQLQTLDFTAPFLRAHAKAFELAERITQYTPPGLNRVFFTNSGSEAVDTAMKIALAYHRARGEGGRTMFVSRERAYHGVNMGGVALSGLVRNRETFGPGVAGVVHMRSTVLPENRFVRGQPPRGAELAEDLARLVALHGAQNIAAVFIEPVAGSTGCLPPPVGYLERVRELCTQHGILLVFDEVINGLGRTGHDFASKAFNVTPDILTMAKALTNGMQPMGAVAVRQDIHDAIVARGPEHLVEFFHGYTYTAHPASCAAGLATLEIYQRENTFEKARELGRYFLDRVFELQDLPCMTDIRGYGLMAAFDLKVKDGKPGLAGHEAQKRLFDAGLHLKATGDAIIMAPAYVAEKKHVDEMISIVRGVFARWS